MLEKIEKFVSCACVSVMAVLVLPMSLPGRCSTTP